MKNKVLSYLCGGLLVITMCFMFGYVHAQGGGAGGGGAGGGAGGGGAGGGECNGIKLNTNFPIIGNCIGDNEDVTKTFPSMVGALTKIVMSLILVVCFILVIVAGIMRAGDNPGQWKGGGAKGLLAKVAITILLLGFSGVILKLINPNFFVS